MKDPLDATEKLARVRGLLDAYGEDVPGGSAEFLVAQLRAAVGADHPPSA